MANEPVPYMQLRKEQHMRAAEEKFAIKWLASESVLRHSTLVCCLIFLMGLVPQGLFSISPACQENKV